jgi:hypothetical protein
MGCNLTNGFAYIKFLKMIEPTAFVIIWNRKYYKTRLFEKWASFLPEMS